MVRVCSPASHRHVVPHKPTKKKKKEVVYEPRLPPPRAEQRVPGKQNETVTRGEEIDGEEWLETRRGPASPFFLTSPGKKK